MELSHALYQSFLTQYVVYIAFKDICFCIPKFKSSLICSFYPTIFVAFCQSHIYQIIFSQRVGVVRTHLISSEHPTMESSLPSPLYWTNYLASFMQAFLLPRPPARVILLYTYSVSVLLSRHHCPIVMSRQRRLPSPAQPISPVQAYPTVWPINMLLPKLPCFCLFSELHPNLSLCTSLFMI